MQFNAELYERQFIKFYNDAFERGPFKRQAPEPMTIRSRATLDVSAAAAGDNDLKFFQGTESDESVRTQDPLINDAGVLEKEVAVAIVGATLIVDAARALTITEYNELIHELGSGQLELKAGQDYAFREYAGKFMQAASGYLVGNDAAGTPLVARSQLQAPGMHQFAAPIMLNGGRRVSSKLVHNGAFTGSTDATVDLLLHGFVARQ